MEGKVLPDPYAVSPAERSGVHPTPGSARGPQSSLLPARPGQALPTALRQPRSRHTAQTSLPMCRPLPRLKDHLFFQRFENDGQEWLSSESAIWEPSEPWARYNPEQEPTARSTAELSAV